MKRESLIIACLAFLVFLQRPNQASSQDTVFYKAELVLINGNRLTGDLFSDSHSTYVMIRPSGKMSIRVPVNIIESITFFSKGDKSSGKTSLKYFNDAAFGCGFGRLADYDNTTANLSAEMTHGFAFRPFLMAGIGLGFDIYESVSVMPYFISISGNLLNKNVTPYYFIQCGISSAWENRNDYFYSKVKGKSMLSFGIGYKIYGGERVFIGFSASYKVQDVELISGEGFGNFHTDRKIKRLGFKIHVGF